MEQDMIRVILTKVSASGITFLPIWMLRKMHTQTTVKRTTLGMPMVMVLVILLLLTILITSTILLCKTSLLILGIV